MKEINKFQNVVSVWDWVKKNLDERLLYLPQNCPDAEQMLLKRSFFPIGSHSPPRKNAKNEKLPTTKMWKDNSESKLIERFKEPKGTSAFLSLWKPAANTIGMDVVFADDITVCGSDRTPHLVIIEKGRIVVSPKSVKSPKPQKWKMRGCF
jgi:hypothetical protein